MEDNTGLYVIFEGVDCAGKTTLIDNVNKLLQHENYDTILTKHPGATALGQHLRTLVKTPQQINPDIVIDPMSAQLLMMVDQIAFCESILKPELNKGSLVLADRCNLISAIIYGLAEGLGILDMQKMYNLVDSPAPDIVFVLSLPLEEVQRRKGYRNVPDRFEDKGYNFIKQTHNYYENLSTISQEVSALLNSFVPLNRIKHIDATLPPIALAEEVTRQIKQLL